MAEKKAGAYGAKPGGGDTDFRKTYDREEYARRADERARREKEEGAARYQAKLEGKTYHRPRAGTPEDLKETTARSTRFDPTSMIGKTTLIAAGSGVGKKNKSLGIWCDVCELAFSNNIEWIEHINLKSHQMRSGLSGEVKRATLEDVQDRLRYLSRKRKEAAKVEALDLDKRLEERREQDEKEREEKRRKRNEKRRSKKQQEEW